MLVFSSVAVYFTVNDGTVGLYVEIPSFGIHSL